MGEFKIAHDDQEFAVMSWKTSEGVFIVCGDAAGAVAACRSIEDHLGPQEAAYREADRRGGGWAAGAMLQWLFWQPMAHYTTKVQLLELIKIPFAVHTLRGGGTESTHYGIPVRPDRSEAFRAAGTLASITGER